MKKIISLSFVLVTFTLIAFSQVTNEISKVPPIKKGEIVLTDGTTINFQQLSVLNDTVVFSNAQTLICKYAAKEIYKISIIGNKAAQGAITFGLIGLAGSYLISRSQDWYDDGSLKKKKTAFIGGATIACAALGGIIGALVEKRIIVYKNSNIFSFQPGVGTYYDNKTYLMLTCRISVK